MSEKLAAALLQLLHFEDGKFCPIIDRQWAKGKTPTEIIACFELDHYPISIFMGGNNHPTNLQWLTPVEHKNKTTSLDRMTHNKVRRKAKKDQKARIRIADEKTNFTVEDVKRIDTYLERNAAPAPFGTPYDPLENDPEAKAAAKKVELTERQKAYRKAIYEKRKLARKKPHGWGKKKW